MVANSPIGTETKKISRHWMGPRMPPSTSPMKEPLMPATWLMPERHPALVLGEGVGEDGRRVGDEEGGAHALEDPHDDQPQGGGGAGHPGDGQEQREEGVDGEAEVVHLHPAVHVAQAAQADHEDAADDEEAQDHPEQVEGVAGEQRVDADAPEDVRQGDEHDGRVDGGHQHARGSCWTGPSTCSGRPARRPRPAGGRRACCSRLGIPIVVCMDALFPELARSRSIVPLRER